MTLKHFCTILLFLFPPWAYHALGQKAITDTIKVNNEICTYLICQPPEQINGILLLLPARGESPKQVFHDTKLPSLLAAKGYLAIVPALPYSLFAGERIKAQLLHILTKESSKHAIKKPNLFVGGFSAGGAVALSFCEFLLSSDTTIGLKGIFLLDPPLDLERLYASSERKLHYDCGGLIHKEGAMTKEFLDKALDGSPSLKPANYLARSPFSASAADGGNAKWLKNIPIRLYSEPDLPFVQKKYCQQLQFEDINAFDLDKLHQFLLQLGNNNSEYIRTSGRGFHSWNIIDPFDLAEWIAMLGTKFSLQK